MENEMENGGRNAKWSMMLFGTIKAAFANFILAFYLYKYLFMSLFLLHVISA